MVQGKKQKGKSGKQRETARREEPETARAGEGDEPSTSQEPGEDSGDEDTATPKLSKPFTNRQDKGDRSVLWPIPVFLHVPP